MYKKGIVGGEYLISLRLRFICFCYQERIEKASMNVQSQLIVDHMTTKFSPDLFSQASQVTDAVKAYVDEIYATSRKGKDEELLHRLTQEVRNIMIYRLHGAEEDIIFSTSSHLLLFVDGMHG